MRFNSARPIKLLSTQEREALQQLLQPDAFPTHTPGPSPSNLGLSVEEFLMIDPEDWRDRITQLGLQRANNSFQPESRSPNDQEATALIFTFGDPVGKILIDIIEIGPKGRGTDDKIRMELPEDYDPDDLDSLAIFIYNATGIWQKKVGLYHHRQGRSDYNYKQLYRLETLNGEQHAEAVKDWFYVSYGNEYRLIGSGPLRLTPREFWSKILKVLGLDKPENPFVVDATQQIVNNHYGCVIKEIQDASKFHHRLGQNYPNPF